MPAHDQQETRSVRFSMSRLKTWKLKALFAEDLAKLGNIVTENKLVAKANASQFIHVKKKIHVSKNKLNFAARNQK